MHIVFRQEASSKENVVEILNDHLMNYYIFCLIVKGSMNVVISRTVTTEVIRKQEGNPRGASERGKGEKNMIWLSLVN